MSPMDPLFVTDSHQALSRQYFLDKLKFILQLCGYDPTLYNGHSFRSAAATSAGKALVEDHIKLDDYLLQIKDPLETF
jgi:site-specific recombinase XerD